MKKLITLLLIFSYFNTSAQDKLSVFAEAAGYNFSEYSYVIDANYKLSDYTSLSSWNNLTSGRDMQVLGGDYFISANTINFANKKNKNVISVGYSIFEGRTLKQRAFIVKLRVKLL
tara:strand:- start:1330 stop:1677 length:348 start_codon:yes stop_codon:yes gene_type:complete